MTDHYILTTADESEIVFGLEWETLIGDNLRSQSKKIAKKRKASHYVPANEIRPSAGFISFTKDKKRLTKARLFSAASIFADANLRKTGVYYERISLTDELDWVVAIQDGVILTNTDVVCSSEAADKLENELKARHPEMVSQDADDVDVTTLINERSRLTPNAGFLGSIPPWAKVSGGMILALIVYDTVTTHYEAYQREKLQKETRDAPEKTVEVNPEKRWEEAIHGWAERTQLSGASTLNKLNAKVVNQELLIGGWKLTQIACESSSNSYICHSNYTRTKSGTNRSFKANAPEEWNLRWSSLENVSATWALNVDTPSVEYDQLPQTKDVSLNYVSDLQAVFPAFSGYTLTPSKQVEIQKPTFMNNDGVRETIEYPENLRIDMPRPVKQIFELDSPMRSLQVLPLIYGADIEKVTYIISRDKSKLDSVSLSRSLISAKVEGSIYAK